MGISSAVRSMRPKGTTGRLNWITICLPGGTSSPSGVILIILRGFSDAKSAESNAEYDHEATNNTSKKNIKNSFFLMIVPSSG